MKVNEKKRIRFRIQVVGIFFLVGLASILARAAQLQILKKDQLDAIARNGYIGTTKLPSKRGTIYDCKGRELAMSVETESVYAHPKQVMEKQKTAALLSRILKQPKKELLNCLTSNRSFVWIKRKVSPTLAQSVKSAKIDGVYVTTEIKRYYPCKESGAHLLGFVGTDNEGLEGLERQYDSYLRGPQGRLIRMRDAMGRPFSVSDPIYTGTKSHDLVLTIDKDIQFKAQEALADAVKRFKAKGGSCVIADPETGEILAMAVMPEFNPNDISSYHPSQWRNRAVTDCYEPGSVTKAFLLAACLEEGVLTPDTRIDCEQGEYRIGGRTIHDTKKHGVISVSDVIVYSSNVGGVKMGQRLGYATFFNYLEKFGFNQKMGGDFLGQREGFIRPIRQTREIDQANLFFGQGMSSTTLQVTMAMAAIANGGKLMRPYVVKSILNESGQVVKETSPQVIHKVISQRTARKVASILEGVVSDEGTGYKASIDGFRVAGKTGTSQKVDPRTKRYSHSKYVAVFAGFVPVDHPKLVIVAAVDEPKGIHYGGLVAGPVFSEVGQWSMNYFRVNPGRRTYENDMDVPKFLQAAEQSNEPKKAKMNVDEGDLPDFNGMCMRSVMNKGKSLGIKVVPEGTGFAVKQHPRPGSPLKRIQMVKVEFRPPS